MKYFLLSFLLGYSIAHRSLYAGGAGEVGTARLAMVISEHRLATDIGKEILRAGGNAVDAAVATGFALSVVYPEAGNLGGGGFMVIRFPDGTSTSIDFREAAPLSAQHDSYIDETGTLRPEWSLRGARAAGVPGTVAGLLYAWEKYGSLPLTHILNPSVVLARKGFVLDTRDARTLNLYRASLSAFPESRDIFFPDDRPLKAGDTLIQNDLAGTLERIQSLGHDGFYRGRTAELIANSMQAHTGWITVNDLLTYRAIERAPLRGRYRDHQIVTVGPPSSGGIALLQMLHMLDREDPPVFHSDEYFIRYAEAMKRAFLDRFLYVGDPDFVRVPLEKLIPPPVSRTPADTETGTGGETTHYSVINENGTAVSVTTTLNSLFGSKLVVQGAGFLLNNEMNDFSLQHGGEDQFGIAGSESNLIEPGKRMVSSMTPVIIARDGKPVLILGARGGPRIITTVFQIITNIIDYRMDLPDAVASPRIHHQWQPSRLEYVPGSIGQMQLRRLRNKGISPVRVSITGRAVAIYVRDYDIVGATTLFTGGGIRGY